MCRVNKNKFGRRERREGGRFDLQEQDNNENMSLYVGYFDRGFFRSFLDLSLARDRSISLCMSS